MVVQNLGAAAIDISGWRIQSYGGDTCRLVPEQVFVFPSGTVLAPRASVRVHSGGAFGGSSDDLLWTRKNMWNNSGDRADLLDAAGQVMNTSAYGRCR